MIDLIGWVKLHRQLLSWEWYSDINTCRLFIHLLLIVNREQKQWRGQTVEVGEIITSINKLAEQTGLTVQQTRTAINKLKSTRELTCRNTNKYSLISITCWEDFQDSNTQPNKQTTNKQQTNNKQITTTKEDKKIRREEKTEAPSKNRGSRWIKPNSIPSTFWEYAHNKFRWADNDIEKVYDTFSDYWSAKPGKDGIKLDWLATWRNWCRRQTNFNQGVNNAKDTRSNSHIAKQAILKGFGLSATCDL